MAQGDSDSERDIWDYKPLRRTKKQKTDTATKSGAKKQATRCCRAAGKTRGVERNGERGDQVRSRSQDQNVGADRLLLNENDARPPASRGYSGDKTLPSTEGHCPSCQMPFSVLLGQSQNWHVTECLDAPGVEEREECPDGFRCSSTNPSHYRKYSHFLLAQRRAGDCQESVPCPSLGSSTTPPSCSSTPRTEATQTPPAARPNAFLLLRSPTPEDIKKRKGWSSTTPRGGGAASTPWGKWGARTATPSHSLSTSGSSAGEISYSPVSTFPAEPEEKPPFPSCMTDIKPFRKTLFPSCMTDIKPEREEPEDCSEWLFTAVDSLRTELVAQSAMESGEDQRKALAALDASEAQVVPVSPLASRDYPVPRAVVVGSARPVSPVGELKEEYSNCAGNGHLRCSPQSLVLDGLRDRLLKTTHSFCSSAQGETARKQEPSAADSGSSKTLLKPESSGLKQTDIGAFFGLKPLKEAEVEGVSAKGILKRAPVLSGGRRRRKASSSLGDSTPGAAGGDSLGDSTPGAAGGRAGGETVPGEKEGRRRWNQRRGCEGTERAKRCPFYKKIPGTGFVVDAFQYGAIEGVRGYFLTHFHSDHYGGLKKSSNLPIYCNTITGNLVKRRLRVEEQFVHVLPMNTECIVDGIRVILLDANHCPGAAMLLFLLPDGQTVLHTGDFRATPAMERFPELLGCRVQTLYLDTTYCSPEYTFPPQQEVVAFAACTAFEQVALNPRTLVVCGTYSVGKEKIFIAVSEVLGSKACLSRDKLKTLSCLEWPSIQRLVSADWHAGRVHVLPMMQLNFKGLQAHLRKFSGKYDQILAFKPTGWTFSGPTTALENIQPQVQENITIYGIPYSEHSSYLEMKRFVQWLRPDKIIPTVNVGCSSRRQAMKDIFAEWRAEIGKLGNGGPV